MAGFSEEQLVQFARMMRDQGTPRTPKVKPPPEYKGDRTTLRTWLVQCKLYYEATRTTEDEDRIAYAKSLLRDAAAKWITPYAEGIRPETWTTWNEFVEALKKQFADVDAENTARTKVESMTQGRKTITDHWNEFRLSATEANYDDKTMQRLFLRGISPTLQDAWAQDNQEVDDTDGLANWAIQKENRINFVQSLKKTSTTTRVVEAPRNTNGTYRATTTTGGDAMDLDATRRRPNFNLSRPEFLRRRNNKLCLACGKPNHFAQGCTNPRDSRDYNRQSWKPRTNAPWQPKPTIKEMEMDKQDSTHDQSGNEESPQ
jgi:hypothetical protein